MYEGEYLKSFSWHMRGSTTIAAVMTIEKIWEYHELMTGETIPQNIRQRIDNLDISWYDDIQQV